MSDLAVPVSQRDHIQGPADAGLLLLEYGDYECPSCTAAYPVVKAIQTDFGDELCFVFRHFPLMEIHPYAEMAAEAAEAAGAQHAFWEMHDMLFEHSPVLDGHHLVTYATRLDLNLDRFRKDLASHRYRPRVLQDIESGLASGVNGTPTFFINGMRHRGGYDLWGLVEALRKAQVASTRS